MTVGRLAGKTAIVTGAARGIGAAIARGLAGEGANVVVHYRGHAAEALALVAEIESAGGRAVAHQANLTDSGAPAALIAAAVQQFGTVDILVNNAGWFPRTPWHAISEDDWDAMLAINLKSHFFCCQAAYPHMRDQGWGRMINISSVTFWKGHVGLAHYVAAKGGIIGFTRTIAREVGHEGITVNAVTPGAILTETEFELFGDIEEQTHATLMQAQSIPRRGQAGDLVGVCLFLASDDSAFITGQTINVDGGWMMH
jgi:3-oxoacyl-[acyl-carrier protein] reductase